MFDSLEVVEAADAGRLLWHKTRLRAVRESRKHKYALSIIHMFFAICEEPMPTFHNGIPDWAMVVPTAKGLAQELRRQTSVCLDLLLCHILPSTSLEKDFEALCRRLGRNPRFRDLHLSADRIYREWARDPDWDMADCPFPETLVTEANALLKLLADELVAWALPRLETLESIFREILNSQMIDDFIEQVVFGEADPPVSIRRTPPLRDILPQKACLEIHRALEPYRAAMLNEIPLDDRFKILDAVAGDLEKILGRYGDNLRLARVSQGDVMWDAIDFDWKATATELLKADP